MVRSVAAALALLLVPSLAPAQEDPARTHAVEEGTTLWHLAQIYYGNPHQWTRIFEANRDRVDDPDVLEAGIVLRIPGEATAIVRGVTVESVAPAPPAGATTAADPAAAPANTLAAGPQERPVRRTVFYVEASSPEARLATVVSRPAFSEDDFHRAHWLAPLEGTPDHVGTVIDLASASDVRHSARPFDQVRLGVEGMVPAVGARLQVFRLERTLDGVGRVAVPTGTLVVVGRDADGVLAEVDDLYDRMLRGDLVRPLPRYPLTPEMVSRPVESATRATVVGFAGRGEIHGVGAYLFLRSSSGDGLRVGDVLEAMVEDAPGGEARRAGSVRVIAVHEGHATARIVELENPVFETGVVVRLSRRMQ